MEKKYTHARVQFTLLILLSLFSMNNSFSQNSNANYYQLTGESINDSKLNNTSVKISNDNSRALSLIYQIHPAIKIENNSVKNISETNQPICLGLDLNSFNALHNLNDYFKSIEMIVIKIKNRNDLNKVLPSIRI